VVQNAWCLETQGTRQVVPQTFNGENERADGQNAAVRQNEVSPGELVVVI
jgi:hypothetical protein